MAPGYNNPDDYLPDDVHYDFLDVQIHRYEYGKPLVEDERSLTTMMRRLHDWYMKTCRESGGRNTLYMRVKAEHDLVGIELLHVHLRSSISLSINWPSIKQRSPATVCKYYYFCH